MRRFRWYFYYWKRCFLRRVTVILLQQKNFGSNVIYFALGITEGRPAGAFWAEKIVFRARKASRRRPWHYFGHAQANNVSFGWSGTLILTGFQSGQLAMDRCDANGNYQSYNHNRGFRMWILSYTQANKVSLVWSGTSILTGFQSGQPATGRCDVWCEGKLPAIQSRYGLSHVDRRT